MSHRRIRDETGRVWDVWEVYPSAVARRMSGEYPAAPTGDGDGDGGTPRREVRVVVPSELQEGWLAFQAGNERRRLAPIPASWTTLDEGALLGLLGRASRASDGRKGG